MLPIAYVTLIDQSEHGYGVRNAVRLISARRSRILINAAPCGGLRRLHSTLKSGIGNLLLYFLFWAVTLLTIKTHKNILVSFTIWNDINRLNRFERRSFIGELVDIGDLHTTTIQRNVKF